MGALQAAEEGLATLARRAVGTVQQCAVARRRVDLYVMLGQARERWRLPWNACGMWAWIGHFIRPRWTRATSTTASGHCLEVAPSRMLLICPQCKIRRLWQRSMCSPV